MLPPIFGSEMVVTVYPASVSGISFGAGTATSSSATVSVKGGIGPFTYAWTYVSGDTFTVTSASAATTTFSKVVIPNGAYIGVYRCTVTPAAGLAKTVDVSIFLQDISYNGSYI